MPFWASHNSSQESRSPACDQTSLLTPHSGRANPGASWDSFLGLFLWVILFIVLALSLGWEGILLNPWL